MQINLPDEIKTLLSNAASQSNFSEQEIIIRGIGKEAKNLITSTNKEKFALKDTTIGSSEWRINKGIEAINTYNEKCDRSQQIKISQSGLFKITGSNITNIKNVLVREEEFVKNYNNLIVNQLCNKDKSKIFKKIRLI